MIETPEKCSDYRVTALQAEARTHRRMAAKALKCRQSDLLPAMPPTVRVHETGATLVTGWERGSDGVQTQISTAL